MALKDLLQSQKTIRGPKPPVKRNSLKPVPPP